MINYIFISLSIILVFVGCSTKIEPTPLIKDAIQSYNEIKNDKKIKQFASQNLDQASKIYSLLIKSSDNIVANHYAYLLKSEVQITKDTLQVAMLKDKLDFLDKKRSEIIKKRQIEEMERRSPKNLADLNPVETKKGLVLTIGDELFEKDKARLLIWSIPKIENLITYLKNNPNRKILIAGFSDDSKSSAYNLDFSLRRAKALADFLIAGGVDKDRIVTKGYGEAHPIADNNTLEGRAKNRRVEIVILNENENIDDLLKY